MFRGLHRSIICLVASWVILPAMGRAEDSKEVKTISTATDNARSGGIGPFYLNKVGVVIRNAEDLVALTSKAKSAKDPEVQKEMEAELAKLLKVDAIDWSKQMLLAMISEGIDPLKTDGKVLMATYVPFKEPGGRAVPRTPKILVLTERFQGEVKFVPKKEVKTLATVKDTDRTANIGPFYPKRDGVVIRNVEELVALTLKATSAKDPAVQKEMEAELINLLKVDAIDWSKQMVLGAIGEGFDPLWTDGKVLTATYVPFKEPLTRLIPPTPKILVLTERFDGEVKLVPKKK